MDNIFGKNFIDGYVPDILELLSNLSSDEVFTPPKIVNQILDTLPSKIWNDKSLKFLDPGCKSGVFLREISKRLMKGLVKDFPEEGERRYHIFKNMLYGNAITQLTSLISRRTLYYTKEPNQKDYSVVQFKDNDGNIKYKQTDHLYENKKKCVYCNASLEEYDRAKKGRETHAYDFIHKNEIFKNMKFDVIIGNPPYQLGDGGFGASASPIYQKFIDQAKKMGARYVAMIVPARWYSGGKGLDEFRDEMMKDKRMKILVDYPDASECFPGVEIKGGVCYFLWDSEYNGKCKISRYFNGEIISTDERSLDEFPTFVRFNEAVPILRKVEKKNLGNIVNQISSRKPFGFATNFEEFSQKETSNSVFIYANKKQGWVKRTKVKVNEDLINKFKILIPKAGEGTPNFPNNIIGKPILTKKNSVCTETYIILGSYDKITDAEKFLSYVKTKLFRMLLYLKKPTQDNPKNTFSYVPNLKMDKEWNDKKLNEYFDLTGDEIKFIDDHIKEMK